MPSNTYVNLRKGKERKTEKILVLVGVVEKDRKVYTHYDSCST